MFVGAAAAAKKVDLIDYGDASITAVIAVTDR